MKCFPIVWFCWLMAGCGEPKEPSSGDDDSGSLTSSSSPSNTSFSPWTDTGTPDCVPGGSPLRLAWPMDGHDTLDWVIVNYVDLNTSPYEMLDYTGAINDNAKVYDGHQGTDIGVSSFREMDAETPIRAAAPGRVVWTVDGFYDRNTS